MLRKNGKINRDILKKLTLDLERILEIMQPDKNLRPKLSSVDFIGVSASSLCDITRPAQVQVRFQANHSAAFKIIEQYLVNRYSSTLIGRYYDNVEDPPANRSAEFNSSDDQVNSEVNNSQDSH